MVFPLPVRTSSSQDAGQTLLQVQLCQVVAHPICHITHILPPRAGLLTAIKSQSLTLPSYVSPACTSPSSRAFLKHSNMLFPGLSLFVTHSVPHPAITFSPFSSMALFLHLPHTLQPILFLPSHQTNFQSSYLTSSQQATYFTMRPS